MHLHPSAPAIDFQSILADQELSEWLRQTLATALTRDPLDVAADAETVAQVLRLRAEASLDEPVPAAPAGVASNAGPR